MPADNPKGIQTVSDLVKCDTLLLGDPESTPIGKIAVKAMTDAGIIEQVKASGAITTSTTAPQIAELWPRARATPPSCGRRTRARTA